MFEWEVNLCSSSLENCSSDSFSYLASEEYILHECGGPYDDFVLPNIPYLNSSCMIIAAMHIESRKITIDKVNTVLTA